MFKFLWGVIKRPPKKKTPALKIGVLNPDLDITDINLSENLTHSVMGVLAAIYESNIIARVNIRDVLKLYGLPNEDSDDQWVEFKNARFQQDYKVYVKNKKIIEDSKGRYFDVPNSMLH